MMKKLEDLEPGAAFRLPFSGLTGVLLALSPGGAKVRYQDRAVEVQIGTEVAFTRHAAPIIISRSTQVEPL